MCTRSHQGNEWASNRSSPPIEVLLATMPFGPLRQPSIALGLLQACVSRETDASVRSRYFTLDWAHRFGANDYLSISEGYPAHSALLGEWFWRPALFDGELSEEEQEVEKYVGRHLQGRLRPALLERLLLERAHCRQFVDECAAEIAASGARVLGLTSVFQQHVATLALARRVKSSAPETLVVLGGANCEGPMGRQTARSFPFVDLVVSGEGERAFVEIVRRTLAGERFYGDLPGVFSADGGDGDSEGVAGERVPARSSRRVPGESLRLGSVSKPPNTRQALDELPIPNYDDFFAQWRTSPVSESLQPRLLFESSRGCWWGAKQHCTFCGLNGLSMAFRSKSAARALGELRSLVEQYGEHTVIAVDNILDMRYFRDFVPALAQGRWPKLCYEVKANLDREKLQMLAAAGIVEILPGVESFSDSVLRLMRKGVTGLQNIQLIKWCRELGIWPNWYLLWGFPGEDPAEYDWMAQMLPQLAHLPPPGAALPIRLDRFSPNFEQRGELGFSQVRPFAAYSSVYPLPDEQLFELAYYFDYDYADGRDVASYSAPLAEAAARWRDLYGEVELLQHDRADETWVFDSRWSREGQLHVLTGLQRDLLHACGGVRRVDALRRELADPGELEVALDELVFRRLVLRRNGAVLALPLRSPKSRRGADDLSASEFASWEERRATG